MKPNRTHTNLTLFIALLLLCAKAAIAGAPSGNPESIDVEVKRQIERALYTEGYYNFEKKQRISAYLWDNKRMLVTTDIPKYREVDLVICIMVRKGHEGFEKFITSKDFSKWCTMHLKN